MKRLTPDSPELKSADLVAENIERLRELFPEAFASEGKIDFDVLRQLLGDRVDDGEERYGLNWHGKRAARQLALTPSTGTLRPCPEESVDWDTTQNIFIEGDNLEVLKLLQKSYAGKVKLIYIDPPYNTGKDFVYPDNFQDSIKNYLELTGQIEGGQRITSNTEASGRFHTDWLNMMYPRLRLARILLQDDGFIVVSIDDAELASLTRLLDEIYGEANHIATLVWDRNRKNDARFFSVGHEYMVIYARDKARLLESGVVLREPKEGIEEARNLFESLRAKHADDWDRIRSEWKDFYRDLSDDDARKPLGRFTKVGPRGPYRDDGDISWPGGGGPKYEVLHPVTRKPCKVPAGGWVYPQPDRFWQEVKNGRVVFGPDETTLPRQCRFLFEGDGQVMRSVNFSYAQTATLDFVDLMGSRVFENPKYWGDLRRLVQYFTKAGDTVLDFFAGSGSTGHGVLAQVLADGQLRRYVLVQIPEPLDSENSDQQAAVQFCRARELELNIAELTKERLRLASLKLHARDKGGCCDGGFRVFKLASSNVRPWDASKDTLAESLAAAVDHVKPDRSEDDLLYDMILKHGLDLCAAIDEKQIGSHKVRSVGGGAVFACFGSRITAADVEQLADGIAKWRDELAPANPELSRVVFRDSAFETDVAKTNMALILKERGFDEKLVVSL